MNEVSADVERGLAQSQDSSLKGTLCQILTAHDDIKFFLLCCGVTFPDFKLENWFSILWVGHIRILLILGLVYFPVAFFMLILNNRSSWMFLVEVIAMSFQLYAFVPVLYFSLTRSIGVPFSQYFSEIRSYNSILQTSRALLFSFTALWLVSYITSLCVFGAQAVIPLLTLYPCSYYQAFILFNFALDVQRCQTILDSVNNNASNQSLTFDEYLSARNRISRIVKDTYGPFFLFLLAGIINLLALILMFYFAPKLDTGLVFAYICTVIFIYGREGIVLFLLCSLVVSFNKTSDKFTVALCTTQWKSGLSMPVALISATASATVLPNDMTSERISMLPISASWRATNDGDDSDDDGDVLVKRMKMKSIRKKENEDHHHDTIDIKIQASENRDELNPLHREEKSDSKTKVPLRQNEVSNMVDNSRELELRRLAIHALQATDPIYFRLCGFAMKEQDLQKNVGGFILSTLIGIIKALVGF